MPRENNDKPATLASNRHELPISVQIGKNGLNDNVIEEIKKHLKKRKLIKIKCLRYFIDSYDDETTPLTSNSQKMKHIAGHLAETVSGRVISVTGFTIILWHKKT
jgi:RNA-binding protein